MATLPKTNWWNTPLKDIGPLRRGLIIGIPIGIIFFLLIFFLFLTPGEPETGIISDVTSAPITVSGAEYNESGISVYGVFYMLPGGDAFIVWSAVVMAGILNLIGFSVRRRQGWIMSFITSVMVTFVFWPLPLWALLIIFSMPLLRIIWGGVIF